MSIEGQKSQNLVNVVCEPPLILKKNQEFKLEKQQHYITFSFLLIKYDFIILDFCISSIFRQKDNKPSIVTKKIKSKYSYLLAKTFKKHHFFDKNEYHLTEK